MWPCCGWLIVIPGGIEMNRKIKMSLFVSAAIPKCFHKQAAGHVGRQQRIAELKASNPNGEAIGELTLCNIGRDGKIIEYSNLETGESEVVFKESLTREIMEKLKKKRN